MVICDLDSGMLVKLVCSQCFFFFLGVDLEMKSVVRAWESELLVDWRPHQLTVSSTIGYLFFWFYDLTWLPHPGCNENIIQLKPSHSPRHWRLNLASRRLQRDRISFSSVTWCLTRFIGCRVGRLMCHRSRLIIHIYIIIIIMIIIIYIYIYLRGGIL